MRRIFLAAAGGSLLIIGSASAAPPRDLGLPLAGAITAPDWAVLPDGDDLASAFPPLAMLMQLEGEATIKCDVATTGTLQACKVVSERPKGLGFGAATVQVASLFKMKPQTMDGVPVAGGTVVVPLRWQLPEKEEDAVAPAAPAVGIDGRPPSPEAIAAGRRLAATLGFKRQVAAWTEVSLKQLDAANEAVGTPEDTAAKVVVLDAVRSAIAAVAPEVEERRARSYAAHLSGPELAQAVAFFESRAGIAVQAEQERLSLSAEDSAQALAKRVGLQAGKTFCSKVACTRLAREAEKPAKPK